jgi:hypothetical protein
VFNVGGSRISEQGAQNRNNAQGTWVTEVQKGGSQKK